MPSASLRAPVEAPSSSSGSGSQVRGCDSVHAHPVHTQLPPLQLLRVLRTLGVGGAYGVLNGVLVLSAGHETGCLGQVLPVCAEDEWRDAGGDTTRRADVKSGVGAETHGGEEAGVHLGSFGSYPEQDGRRVNKSQGKCCYISVVESGCKQTPALHRS